VARLITDEIPDGTVARSQAITDAKPDTYVYGTREEYEAGMEAVRNDETLSGPERDDILASTPEPEETFEEYMERHGDE
jgi:Asp-tRNA(Asn)/Glu-tRNA(Gln) amidotransferase C subunit